MYAEVSGVGRHEIAIVLGSGWGGVGGEIGTVVAEVPAQTIPGFDPAPIPGHSALLRSVRIAGTVAHALLIGARAHYYERRDVRAVAHPIRMAAYAGARICVLTNGCGAIAPWPPGTVALISDHLNLTGATPLEGPSFLDLTDLYSSRLRAIVRGVFPEVREGVYAQFPGPQYETPAEVRMAGILGACLVGMSTALEAIAACEAGMEVLGLSLVTNPAAGIAAALDTTSALSHKGVLAAGRDTTQARDTTPALSHEEVVAAGRDAAPRLSAMLGRLVPLLLQPAN